MPIPHARPASPEDALARVCLHEYAHLVVARALGACGYVRIRLGPNGFAGAFHMHDHASLDERAWRVVALAGTLAEWLDDAPRLDVADACERLARPMALSHEDATLGAGHDAHDVRRCLHLLREHWNGLLLEAEERARSHLPQR
jgi:hypothetical protein